MNVIGYAIHTPFRPKWRLRIHAAGTSIATMQKIEIAVGTSTVPLAFKQLRIFPDATPAARVLPIEELRSRYYLRIMVRDQPGVIGQISTILEAPAGFHIVRQGKHIVMSDGVRILTIPRHDPVNAFTLGGIVRDAGLTEEEFRKLL